MRFIDELSLAGKKVLMRVDFNVPLDDNGNVTDDNRIRAAMPSIEYAIDSGAMLILCSHLGRPKGKKDPRFSLKPVADLLGVILNRDVTLAPDCVGDQVRALVEVMKPGECILLENLRYHSEEQANDPGFAGELAALADVYINDAFAVSHRAHASVVGVPEFVKECGAGLLLKKELSYFKKAMENPARPLVAILGGAKVSSKLGAIENILQKVDKLIVGGAMANTFLAASGFGVGRSLVEADLLDTARSIMARATKRGVKFYLPVDCLVAEGLGPDFTVEAVTSQEIPEDKMALDIGPASITLFEEALRDVETIVWNGPMGAFEVEAFAGGTQALAHAVGASDALSIIGGGDTDHAVHMAGEKENVSYMSTGGGAFLRLLEGKELPGIKALGRCGARRHGE